MQTYRDVLEQLPSLVILSKLSEPLFKELEILSFKKLVIQRILLMMFKYLLDIVPKPITLLFTRNDEIHHHNIRHSRLLHPMIGTGASPGFGSGGGGQEFSPCVLGGSGACPPPEIFF